MQNLRIDLPSINTYVLQWPNYSCTDLKHPNFLCFGPVSVTDVPETFDELSLQAQEAIKSDIKVSKDRIAKAHKRVVEKVKEIRHNY